MREGRCPHRTVQQFTEICLDCGRNVYETDAEYLKYLEKIQLDRATTEKEDAISKRIVELERKLHITHPGNS